MQDGIIQIKYRDAETPEQREERLVKCREYAHRNQFKHLILYRLRCHSLWPVNKTAGLSHNAQASV